MKKGREPKLVMHYEISVWDDEGDVVRKLWDASEEELAEVREAFADEPRYSIVIDRDWEEPEYGDGE